MTALAGRVALVTGAGSGIGRAISVALALAGARLVLAGRRRRPLTETASLLPTGSHLSATLLLDVTSESDIERAVTALRADQGELDILVHSAGLHTQAALAEITTDDFDALFATNVRGPWLLTRALLPMLIAAHGDVVFIVSSAVREPRAVAGAYAASKLALGRVADSFRDQLNPSDVRFLSVFPGRTATGMQEAIHQSEGRSYRPELLLQPEDVASMVVAAISLPRRAEVTDLHLRPRAKQTT